MTDDPRDGHGLADLPASDLGPAVLSAWDEFLAAVSDTDPKRPTRLKGWTAHDVLVHLGAWPDHDAVTALLTSAGASTTTAHLGVDSTNATVVAAHADATHDDVLSALHAARERAADYFASGRHDESGRELGLSVLGALPIGTVVHAVSYELAVHALDLGIDPAQIEPLLLRGLAALTDTTGALSARHGITVDVAAVSPLGGWQFRSGPVGWSTTARVPGPVHGPGIEGSAALILDASAGRVNAVPLLLSRKLVVHKLPTILRLAPLIEEVPGIPGGSALKGAVKHLAGAGRLLGKLPGLRR